MKLTEILPGHNQSPEHSLARTSIFPYRKANESRVRIRALLIGFRISVPAFFLQPSDKALVQLKKIKIILLYKLLNQRDPNI